MGRGKSTTLRRPQHPTGRIETATDRRDRMSRAFKQTMQSADSYDQAPEMFEEALDELVVSLGSLGASMGDKGATETIEPEPPARDDLLRASLRLQLLWMNKDGLPESLRGPLYEITLTETRWRKLSSELRGAITHYRFKRDCVGRSAQYVYESLEDSRLPADSLAAFEQAMLEYA